MRSVLMKMLQPASCRRNSVTNVVFPSAVWPGDHENPLAGGCSRIAHSHTEVDSHDAIPDAGMSSVVPVRFSLGGERNDVGLVVRMLRAIDHEEGTG